MMGRFVLTSGLIFAGAVAFSPQVFAQTVDIPFQGNVGPQCSFAAPVPGTLVMNQTGPGDLISSDAPGGVSGQVDVSCNSFASISITNAKFVSFTPANPGPEEFFPPSEFSFQHLEAHARNLQNGIDTFYSGLSEGGGITSPTIPLNPTVQTVEVDLRASGDVFIAGIYNYAVTLTITP